MPRGRHRQAPPLHRMLAPSAVAGAALFCALVAWLVGDVGAPGVVALRVLTTGAALAAVAGAVLLRHWDREAGRRVAEVRAARATAEWRAEERQAELETELEEAAELRRKVEITLREKQAELTRLRTEHAALLRRYATAETERASALEGRRQLALEAAGQVKELTTGAADHRRASGAPTPLTYLQASEALARLRTNAVLQEEQQEKAQREREDAERKAAEEREPAVPPPGREPYPSRSGSQTPKRGGFDFFGTGGAPRRRRGSGGPRPPAESPSDRDEEGDRAAGTPPGPESGASAAGEVIRPGAAGTAESGAAGPDGEDAGSSAGEQEKDSGEPSQPSRARA
ncbi:hypothetical protein V1L54_24810 [Streptomyces sp. TRM 70361]|uniref:hypothetical protein n=1 Tax=Streptomyces sp. TRM 70361 TaxID=3116553 RepID=UPI002E7B1D3B|nr:hypothetical protein [Streptomyces sp. TRM 70361]MEE1942585.1 hypothetical protein [Streptomyces sp. TRM 70361]